MLTALFRLWQLLLAILTVAAATNPTPTKRHNSGPSSPFVSTQNGHFFVNGRYVLIDHE